MSAAPPTGASPPRALAVIPARFDSQRLPGKVLLDLTGKPLIQHVWEQVSKASLLHPVLVATDDERVLRAATAFGAQAVLTRADHPSGTDRVAELARDRDEELIVNIQGDEPDVDPDDLDRLVRRLSDHGEDMATLARPLGPHEGHLVTDPNAVKVVFDAAGRALYFSRSPIPHGTDPVGVHLHLGVYAYRRAALLDLAAAPQVALERRERLEQLRALSMGLTLGVVITHNDALGIDTAEDYARFVQRHGSAEPTP